MDTLTGTCVRTFTGSPASVSQARAWVASFLPGSPAADDAALLTSELFTNAILYSASRLPGGVVLVSVRTGKTWIRVDVIDQGEVPPCIAAPPGLGQGLEIVRQLADAFGDEDGSRWFSLRTGRYPVTAGAAADPAPAVTDACRAARPPASPARRG